MIPEFRSHHRSNLCQVLDGLFRRISSVNNLLGFLYIFVKISMVPRVINFDSPGRANQIFITNSSQQIVLCPQSFPGRSSAFLEVVLWKERITRMNEEWSLNYTKGDTIWRFRCTSQLDLIIYSIMPPWVWFTAELEHHSNNLLMWYFQWAPTHARLNLLNLSNSSKSLNFENVEKQTLFFLEATCKQFFLI